MESAVYRAFSDELVKIGGEPLDAAVRALKADRRGDEYLAGGQLPSNAPLETNFVPKLGTVLGAGSAFLPHDAYNPGFKDLTPEHTTRYEKIRDAGGAALKGGTAAAGVTSLVHALKHQDLKPASKTLRWAVPVGAGLSLADHLYQRRRGQEKQASFSSQTFTPARQLSAGNKLGRFERVLHRGVVKPVSGLT